MKYLLNSLVIFTMLFIGCNKEECDPITPPVDDRILFEINFLQYSDNNYFIDQVYADTSAAFNMYNQYYGSINPIVMPKYYIKNIEVYKSANSIFDEGIIATAYISLPPRSSDSMYAYELRNLNTIIPGQNDASRFILLDEGNDYIFHRETGWISFINPIMEQEIIAVAYKIENEPGYTDDLIYGEFISELVNNSKTRGVLKLVKPRDLRPFYELAWNLKMKNVYQTG